MLVTKGRFERHCDRCQERITRLEQRIDRLEDRLANHASVYVGGGWMPTTDAVSDIAEHLGLEIKPSAKLRLAKKK